MDRDVKECVAPGGPSSRRAWLGHTRLRRRQGPSCLAGPPRTGAALYRQRQRVYTQQA